MAKATYFCVVEDYEGNVSVASFLCRNTTEERKAALTMYRFCWLITTDHDEAQRYAAVQRKTIQTASK